MPILYSLVARDGVVLGEHTDEVGNFQTITRILLPRVPKTQPRISYIYDDYVFHHYFRDSLCFVAMCGKNVKISLPYLFLEETADLVQRHIPPIRLHTAAALSLNTDLQPLLAKAMQHWNSLAANGCVSTQYDSIKKNISGIQEVLIDNIDKLVARSEKIDLLVDKTAELRDSAVGFRRQARDFHRQAIWRQRRLYFILFTICAVAVWSALCSICGGGIVPHCRV